MGMAKNSTHKLSFSMNKKNVLFLSILAVSAVMAVAVFAALGAGSWSISSGYGNKSVNQSYVGAQYTNTTINFTANITLDGTGQNFTFFNLTGTNGTGWSFLGIGPVSTFNGSLVTCQYSGALAQAAFGNTSLNCTVGSSSGADNISNISIVFGINFSVEGIYNFSANFSSNNTSCGGGQFCSNTSNFTILADFTNPNLTAVSVNNVTFANPTTGNGSANATNTIHLNFSVNDTYLNFSTLGSGARPLRVVLYDANSNTTTRFVRNIRGGNNDQVTNLTVSTKVGGDIWNFSVNFTLNDSMCEWGKAVAGVCANDSAGNAGVHFNATAYIELNDNASHNVTRYWSGWVFLDNRTPQINSTGTISNNSQNVNPDAAVQITWSEPMDASVLNTSLYSVSVTGGRAVNFTLSATNQSSTTYVTITIPGMNYSTNYTVSVNASTLGAPKDLIGNFFNTTPYNITFKTADQASGTGSGGATGSGGGTSSVVVQNVVSEEKPAATVSFSVGESATFSVGGESHSLKVDSVAGGLVTVTILSDPIKLQLKVNTPTYVDVDGDGDNDIIVTVLEVLSTTAAKLKIEYLASAAKTTTKKSTAPAVSAPETEPAAEVSETPAAEETVASVEQPAETQGMPQSTLLLVAVVIIVLVGLGYWYTQKK